MQKARRHPDLSGLRPIVGTRFQVLFTPLFGVLFTFPSRYWYTIGLPGVFSLAGWCRLIQAGFLRSPPTQDTVRPLNAYMYGAVTRYRAASQLLPLRVNVITSQSY